MSENQGVRLDKWLQVARAFKTRSQATDACTAGRVAVNGSPAKPHKVLKVDDRVEIEMQHSWKRILIVKGLRDKPVSKNDARLLFEDASPPKPELDPIEQIIRRAPSTRPRGSGRPTKRQRREIDRLKDQD